MIFFFMEIVQIMKKFLASYQRNIKNELLSRLAYHDEFVFISTKPDIETVFMNASKKMMENPGVKKRLFSAIQNGNIDDWMKCTKPSDAS